MNIAFAERKCMEDMKYIRKLQTNQSNKDGIISEFQNPLILCRQNLKRIFWIKSFLTRPGSFLIQIKEFCSPDSKKLIINDSVKFLWPGEIFYSNSWPSEFLRINADIKLKTPGF